ncbi:MAG: 3'-5' exonuclease [Bacteroidia bacterium]|nr:3'-5' exonuclease [Bacteroidia bacterium]
MEFLNDLNDAQREAVTSLEGPHLVIAGAGSGKTRVLTYRLAFILSQGLADPQELLALTFTNKAAREMKERIHKLVGPEAKSIVMGTFHSIFSRILRIEAEKIGYTSAYTIYDADDAQKQIRDLLKERGLDDKTYKPKVISHAISMAKNRLVSPQEYRDFATDDFNLKIAELFALYEQRLFRSNAMDFDDLLIKPVHLFRQHPGVLYKYQHRFKYLMIDEYQDTNHAQYVLTNMLASVHQNICVVGDDAQSIYGFRGANIQNILNLKQDYPDLKIMKLEENYRSTQNIVEAANSIIARNKEQIPKTIYTRNPAGESIYVVESISEQDEARRVSDSIREQKQTFSYFNRDFAVLYRTNAQSRAMEDELRRAGLRYKVYGGLSFYQRKEIKDMVAYLRLAVNPKDEQSLLRVINYPARGIGKTSLERIIIATEERQRALWEVIEQADQLGLGPAVSTKVRDFVIMIRSFGVIARNNNAYVAASHIAKHSGILKDLNEDKTSEGIARWENVQELLNAAQAFAEGQEQPEAAGLDAFLADISLFTDQDDNPDDDDFVTLMTIHSAKGLEFKSVFLVGMEENLFPSALSMETRADLEEERRLLYVAVTRARERLTLSYARSRYRFGEIQFNEVSRFIEEIDPKYLRRAGQSTRREAVSPVPPGRRPAGRPAVQRPAVAAPQPESTFAAARPEDIAPGQHILHQKFGRGEVVSVEGEGANQKATIHFREGGRRVLLLKYARLQILS